MFATGLPASGRYWDRRNLTELLALDCDGQNRYRSHACDIDAHGRLRDGQLIAQTLWAAAQGVEGRGPGALQLTLLNEAHPLSTVEYSVELLQGDRRCSHRHVYGVQGTGLVLSAHASFHPVATNDPMSSHLDRKVPAPDDLPALTELAAGDIDCLQILRWRSIAPSILDVRPVPVGAGVCQPGETVCWVRLKQSLPDEGCLHHAALAYMSDGWFDPCDTLASGNLEISQPLRVSGLNHSLWFHSPTIDANDWLLFLIAPVCNLSGRCLLTAQVYQRHGRLVASIMQQLQLGP